jgi:hypothetical protein
MASQSDLEREMRLRMNRVVPSQGFSGDKNSKKTAAAAKAGASKPGDQERNRQLRETERNRYNNANKGKREAAERASRAAAADRLKPPAAPASTPSAAKKSAVSKILDKVKGNSGRGAGFGRGGGVGILRLGGGGTASKVK